MYEPLLPELWAHREAVRTKDFYVDSDRRQENTGCFVISKNTFYKSKGFLRNFI